MSLGARTEIASSMLSPVPSFTVVVWAQPLPVRCSARLPSPPWPTVQTSPAERATTPNSRFSAGSGEGDPTTLQLEPSQCIVSVRQLPLTSYQPTAQASVAEITSTPVRSRKYRPGFGAGTSTHAEPFQCSVTESAALSPTAQTSPPGVAETLRKVVPLGPGAATELHWEPFQCSEIALPPSSP